MSDHGSSSARSGSAAKSSVEGSKHTPGPWAVLELRDTDRCLVSSNCLPDGSERAAAEKNGGFMVAHTLGPQREANARLIATAPDHALVCWAMCVQDARWEEWGAGKGEFCFAGLRHATTLDEFGAPVLTDHLRGLLAAAKATSPADTASPTAATDRTS